MGHYSALKTTSEILQTLLKTHITDSEDQQFKDVPVTLQSPKEMRESQIPVGISIWLYRVTLSERRRSQPGRVLPDGRRSRPPIPLDLHYLLTPFAPDPARQHMLLGRLLQLLEENVVLPSENIEIVAEQLTFEELALIWNGLQEPYHLSVAYCARDVQIDVRPPG